MRVHFSTTRPYGGRSGARNSCVKKWSTFSFSCAEATAHTAILHASFYISGRWASCVFMAHIYLVCSHLFVAHICQPVSRLSLACLSLDSRLDRYKGRQKICSVLNDSRDLLEHAVSVETRSCMRCCATEFQYSALPLPITSQGDTLDLSVYLGDFAILRDVPSYCCKWYVVMVFFCQRFSFATKHESTVVSCEKAVVQLEVEEEESDPAKNKCKMKPSSKDVTCYEVIFEDTVFFPEGGGQPDDRGVVTPLQCPVCGPPCSSQHPTLPQLPPEGGAPEGGAPEGGAPEGGAPEGGAPEGGAPEGGAPEGGAPEGGAPESDAPEGGAPESGAPPTDIDALLYSSIDDASSAAQCPHGASVLRVLRRGLQAVHYLDAPLPVGEKVLQVIDWKRRKDHMQQHSAQHLLTAVTERLYGVATTSWSMGRVTSNLELHTRSLTETQLGHIETRANAVIAAALPISVREYADTDDIPQEVRSRGLPVDHTGRVRVVSIAGLDHNMCCGTHATNTAQLQAIKIIGAEPGKQNKTLVTFVAGDRLLRYLSECHATLRSLNPLLHTGPEEYVSAVSKLQRNLKAAEKSSKEALKDLAAAEAKLLVKKVKTLQDTWQQQQQQQWRSHDGLAAVPCQHREVIHVRLDDDNNEKDLINSKISQKEGISLKTCSIEDCGQKSVSADHGGVVSDAVGPLMFVTHHRRLADMNYINAIANGFTIKEAVLLLTAGEDRGAGGLVLMGPQSFLEVLGPKLCEVLEGKGGGKTRYSARVSALHRRHAAADAALTMLTQLCER
ncbi:Threonyl/alanyl tRNA synthetase SAD [Trinorchestia longiramus]|nr:Threonyl/alanyl tRNA synthetase SAD [Trinorchestia longiramus]